MIVRDGARCRNWRWKGLSSPILILMQWPENRRLCRSFPFVMSQERRKPLEECQSVVMNLDNNFWSCSDRPQNRYDPTHNSVVDLWLKLMARRTPCRLNLINDQRRSWRMQSLKAETMNVVMLREYRRARFLGKCHTVQMAKKCAVIKGDIN